MEDGLEESERSDNEPLKEQVRMENVYSCVSPLCASHNSRAPQHYIIFQLAVDHWRSVYTELTAAVVHIISYKTIAIYLIEE